MCMAGSSSTSAPSSASASRSPDACADARVTTTRRPNSGRRSNQAISSRSETTAPITVITGAVSPSRATASASVDTVAATVRCRAYVPHCTAAAGVWGDMPPSTSAAAMRGSVFTPMYSTIVPPARASAAQSVCVSALAGSSWPVTNVTDVATPRCVTGIPA